MRRIGTGHDYETTCFLSIRFLTASGLFSSLAAMWTELGNDVLFERIREIAKSDYWLRLVRPPARLPSYMEQLCSLWTYF